MSWRGARLAVTAGYDFYRLCRVDDDFTWTGQSSTSYETSVSIVEVAAQFLAAADGPADARTPLRM